MSSTADTYLYLSEAADQAGISESQIQAALNIVHDATAELMRRCEVMRRAAGLDDLHRISVYIWRRDDQRFSIHLRCSARCRIFLGDNKRRSAAQDYAYSDLAAATKLVAEAYAFAAIKKRTTP